MLCFFIKVVLDFALTQTKCYFHGNTLLRWHYYEEDAFMKENWMTVTTIAPMIKQPARQVADQRRTALPQRQRKLLQRQRLALLILLQKRQQNDLNIMIETPVESLDPQIDRMVHPLK